MTEFTDDVRRFVRRRIDSVELLEVLLLLLGEPAREWTVDQISAELRSTPHSIARRLRSLCDSRLAHAAGTGYRYAASARDDAAVRRLRAVYQERRTSVIDYIFSSRDALQSFSDAFKVRERNDDR